MEGSSSAVLLLSGAIYEAVSFHERRDPTFLLVPRFYQSPLSLISGARLKLTCTRYHSQNPIVNLFVILDKATSNIGEKTGI